MVSMVTLLEKVRSIENSSLCMESIIVHGLHGHAFGKSKDIGKESLLHGLSFYDREFCFMVSMVTLSEKVRI